MFMTELFVYKAAVTHDVTTIHDASGIVYVRLVLAVFLNVIVEGPPARGVEIHVVVISKHSVVKKDTGFVDVQNGTVDEYTLPPIVIEFVFLHAGLALNLKALKAKAPPITPIKAIIKRRILAFLIAFC